MRAEELREPLERFKTEAKGAVDGLREGIDAVRDLDRERKEPVEKPGKDDA